MQFKQRMTEQDWENIDEISSSSFRSLKKWVDVQNYNTAQAALQAGNRKDTTKKDNYEMEISQSIPEQLASLRGEVFGSLKVIRAIKNASKEKEALIKKKEEFEKRKNASYKKNDGGT